MNKLLKPNVLAEETPGGRELVAALQGKAGKADIGYGRRPISRTVYFNIKIRTSIFTIDFLGFMKMNADKNTAELNAACFEVDGAHMAEGRHVEQLDIKLDDLKKLNWIKSDKLEGDAELDPALTFSLEI